MRKKRSRKPPGFRPPPGAREYCDRFDRAKKNLRGAAIPVLMDSLRSPDAAVSRAARQVLEARPRESVPALVECLKNPSSKARPEAVAALGSIACQGKARALLPAAAPALADLLAKRALSIAVGALLALLAVNPRHPAIAHALVAITKRRGAFLRDFLDSI
jgi:HEAT repeat protein